MVEFDFLVIWDNLPFLAEAMQLSLLLTALAICGGIALGTILALLRLSGSKLLAAAVTAYVNLFRSIPLILVIFWFYFLVPLFAGRPVGPFYSALISFVLFEAAYYCEIIRAGIQSISRGQITAAQATGMTYLQGMRHVVLPQAFRNVIPILVSQAVALFQDTALVYVVALQDFMTASTIIALRDFKQVELYTFAALVYLVICSVGSWVARRMKRSYGVATR